MSRAGRSKRGEREEVLLPILESFSNSHEGYYATRLACSSSLTLGFPEIKLYWRNNSSYN